MRRLAFPLVNTAALTMLFSLLGYYVLDPVPWMLAGAGTGLALGLIVEFGSGLIGRWLYRRRLLLILLEIPFVIFVFGPYAVVIGFSRPAQRPVCCVTPADFGADYDTVQIPVADGEQLAGWYVPPRAPHGAAIILLHGSASTRLGTFWHAERLAGAGYGLLMYDQRALGESTGAHQSMGWLDARDVPYVVDFLTAQPEVNPERIGAVGLSLGGHILLLAGPDEARIRAFFLDGVSATRIEDFPQAQNASEQFGTFINDLLVRAQSSYLGIEPPPPLKSQIPRLADRAVLMIVSPLDDFERRANAGFLPLLGDHGEQWIIENAFHVGGPVVIPEAYAARMITFFDAALIPD